MGRLRILIYAVVFVSMIALCGCEALVPHDTASLLVPSFKRSEILGLVAGFGTTFAAVPDMLAMFRRRSSAGMNPRMAMIMGVFQVLWVYYGLLIASRPVIVWNIIAVLINFFTVFAYRYFVQLEKAVKEKSLRADGTSSGR
jgi:MtN3 and saliva related transmembrane protein